MANDLAMHVAAANPQWVKTDEVPAAVLDKEKELIAATARNEGKPDHIVEKIVEGRLNSFFQDNVLMEQTFVRSEKFEGTVGTMVGQMAATMGENISVNRFSRLAVGEELDAS
jgi:elongation factor Ts